MSERALAHATSGQTIINDGTAITGNFTGLLVTVAGAVSAMTWSAGYAPLKSAGGAGSWVDLGSLPVGYYPGNFTGITGDGTLRAIAIHA